MKPVSLLETRKRQKRTLRETSGFQFAQRSIMLGSRVQRALFADERLAIFRITSGPSFTQIWIAGIVGQFDLAICSGVTVSAHARVATFANFASPVVLTGRGITQIYFGVAQIMLA
jgi:hypothetical protein